MDPCAVCLEEMTEDQKNMCHKIKECGHSFHTECIIQSLRFDSRCPVCRSRPIENKQQQQLNDGGAGDLGFRPEILIPIPIDNYKITNRLISRVSKLDPDVEELNREHKSARKASIQQNIKLKQITKKIMKQKTFIKYSKIKSLWCRYKNKAFNTKMDLLFLVRDYIANHSEQFRDIERIPVEDIFLELQH
jgi:hypothetical protein